MDEQIPVSTILRVISRSGAASLDGVMQAGVPSRRQSTGKHEASVLTLLDVLADFDRFGGASPELVAWEIDIDASLIAPAWSRALADGLLEQGETDHALGENLYRLSERGRRAREQSDDVSA